MIKKQANMAVYYIFQGHRIVFIDNNGIGDSDVGLIVEEIIQKILK